MNDLLHLTRLGEMPPGGFVYMVPETKVTIPVGRGPFTCLDDLQKAVNDHYLANRLLPPPNLRALVEDSVCRRLGPHWCETSHGVAWTKNAGMPMFSVAALKQFTHTIMSWARDGDPPVPLEQVEQRANVCLSCPMHGYPTDCGSCATAEIVATVGSFLVGTRIPADTHLKACKVCACMLRVKVRAPLAAIRRHMPKAQLEALPPACWINVESTEAPS